MKTHSSIPDVQQARNCTYFCSVVLKDAPQNEFQLVFASQQYGTFYGIYARFHTQKQGERCKLNQIQFRIINYKGLINIGIEAVKPPRRTKDIIPKIKMDLILKGLMSPLQDYICDLSQEDIFLTSGTEFIFKRVLHAIVTGPDQSFNTGIFDEEFHFRDGLYPIDAPISKLEDQIETKFPKSKPKLGDRCPKTLVRIEMPCGS